MKILITQNNVIKRIKVRYHTKQFILTFLISLLVLGITTTIQTEAKTYTDYKGDKLTQEQYDTRVQLCLKMQQNGDVDPGTDCYSWVLTYEGIYEITKKFIFEKSYSIEGN